MTNISKCKKNKQHTGIGLKSQLFWQTGDSMH